VAHIVVFDRFGVVALLPEMTSAQQQTVQHLVAGSLSRSSAHRNLLQPDSCG